MKQILVLGSLNADLVQRVPRLPVCGETLAGGGLQIFVGGKGANQACAAARLGGVVQMAGKVGSDIFGTRLLNEVKAAGVGTDLVQISGEPSGTAVIFVLPNGDNVIIISAGANADISEDFALDAIGRLQRGDLLLCQLEMPLEAVFAALKAAHAKGVTTILDPAPARELPAAPSPVSILTPNQTEAASLLGLSEAVSDFREAEIAARQLQKMGVETVIIKMGRTGCYVAEPNGGTAIQGHPVKVVDTTAAGDTFNGALAAMLAKGASRLEAARFANAAAALSVTKPGAIASIPEFDSVQEFQSAQPVNK